MITKILKFKLDFDLKFLRLKNNNINDAIKAKIKEVQELIVVEAPNPKVESSIPIRNETFF